MDNKATNKKMPSDDKKVQGKKISNENTTREIDSPNQDFGGFPDDIDFKRMIGCGG